jgi:hypothetical protein
MCPLFADDDVGAAERDLVVVILTYIRASLPHLKGGVCVWTRDCVPTPRDRPPCIHQLVNFSSIRAFSSL